MLILVFLVARATLLEIPRVTAVAALGPVGAQVVSCMSAPVSLGADAVSGIVSVDLFLDLGGEALGSGELVA